MPPIDVHGNPTYREVFVYRADEDEGIYQWRQSIHMPRAASRITLELSTIRVERLQEISPDDARAEGIFQTAYYDDWLWSYQEGDNPEQYATVERAYQALWESINSKGSWNANPLVWVLTFMRAS